MKKNFFQNIGISWYIIVVHLVNYAANFDEVSKINDESWDRKQLKKAKSIRLWVQNRFVDPFFLTFVNKICEQMRTRNIILQNHLSPRQEYYSAKSLVIESNLMHSNTNTNV